MIKTFIVQKGVFAKHSDFLIPISLQYIIVVLRYFKNMNSVRSHNLSFKYQRFTTLGCKDIEIRNFEFVAKT